MLKSAKSNKYNKKKNRKTSEPTPWWVPFLMLITKFVMALIVILLVSAFNVQLGVVTAVIGAVALLK